MNNHSTAQSGSDKEVFKDLALLQGKEVTFELRPQGFCRSLSRVSKGF